MADERPTSVSAPRPGEVATYFLRLGVIAFGGPAAHIAIMRRELVQRRKWVTDQQFMDHFGVTNLIPGPNSTEMVMHMGAIRGGRWGLYIAGLAFILPAFFITLACAWAYVRYGETPAGEALIYGIQPVILAVIIQAAWGLRGAAFRQPDTIVIAIAAGALGLSRLPLTNEAVLIIGSGILVFLWRSLVGGTGFKRPRLPRFRMPWNSTFPFAFLAVPAGYSLPELFLIFLKIGAVLYGSGYVLIAFMETDLVHSREWITYDQLVDAIAVGQFTPGPVFTAATFAGYLIDGVPGAIAATAGIFLPSFFFVAITHPFVPRLRQSPWASPFLDGVNAAALALMTVVSFQLAIEALADWYAAGLFIAAALVLIRFNPNSGLLVLAGALAGIAHALVT
jgi:chromate transporter